jgi:hypothetical protein
MSEFLYVYRGGSRAGLSPEQIQQIMQKWMSWMQGLAEKGHLKDRGHPLEGAGKLVSGRGKNVTDGPYAEKDLVCSNPSGPLHRPSRRLSSRTPSATMSCA